MSYFCALSARRAFRWGWSTRRNYGRLHRWPANADRFAGRERQVIGQLEGMKEFDIAKDQMSRIEIKKPGLLGAGRITITPTNGKPVKITLRHRIAYDRLMQLIRAFSSQIVASS